MSWSRIAWSGLALVLLSTLLVAAGMAPEFMPVPQPDRAFLPPFEAPPFGTDSWGLPLLDFALQGAAVVTVPACCSGLLVMVLAAGAGLSRCAGGGWIDAIVAGASEIVGALPRIVVVLVVAMLLPRDWRSLMPIGLTWAILAAPGAMDEAAATAERLGGQRFVEALRAHGFSRVRIYGLHVVARNLRPVLVRQGAEVTMQVVFLEIALSYLALRRNEPSFTHADSTNSWATLLYQGYTALLGEDLMHALWLGLALVASVALLATSVRIAARAR